MAAFPAAINETGALKRGDKFFYFLWHEITDGCLVVKGRGHKGRGQVFQRTGSSLSQRTGSRKGRGQVFRYHMILKDLTLLTLLCEPCNGFLVPLNALAGLVRNHEMSVLDLERLGQYGIRPVLPLEPVRSIGDTHEVGGDFRIKMS